MMVIVIMSRVFPSRVPFALVSPATGSPRSPSGAGPRGASEPRRPQAQLYVPQAHYVPQAGPSRERRPSHSPPYLCDKCSRGGASGPRLLDTQSTADPHPSSQSATFRLRALRG